MADVVKLIISANTIKNGGAVHGVDNLGHYHVVRPTIVDSPTQANLENKYTNKFINENYYGK